MILHFSHIGLTDGRTFMIPFGRCSRRGGSGGRAGHRYHAPGAHVARERLAAPSATKQNTKRLRQVMKGVWAALSALLVAPPAPTLVHASGERFRATSAEGGRGVPAMSALGADRRAPTVYARDAGGWRQYWIFYAANPQDRGVLRSGRHAGDWELVQYRGREAVYAQHSGAERCGSFETRDGHPVVYVAEGSHASYFHAGARDRMWPDPNDFADGRGAVIRPRVASISGEPWLHDPRPWGGARAGWFPPEQSSPRGPAFQGLKWDDPDAWAASAPPCTGRRCVTIGACDGPEKALTAGLIAVPLLVVGLVLSRRRRRRARR
jgi:hypothetical protein